MATPSAVRKKAEEVDRMIREQAELARGEAPTEQEADAADDQAADPAQDAPTESTPETDPGVAPQAAESSEPTGTLAEAQEAAEKWEQRYRSLDGMIKSRDRQIEQLYDMIAKMQAAPAPAAEAAPAPPTTSAVTESDIDAFGADLVDLVRRIAGETYGQQMASLETRLKDIEAGLGDTRQVVAESREERFMRALTEAAPNWRKTDQDPAFIEWLKGSAARLQVFKAAADSMDVATLAEFYVDWEKRQAPKPTELSPAAKKRAAELEKQVAPGRRVSAPAPQDTLDSGEKKQWTRSEIAATYANRKNMRPEEFSKLERDIMAAQRENRVDFDK